MQRINTSLFIILFVFETLYSFGQRGLSFKLYQKTDIFQRSCIFLSPKEYIQEVKVNFSRISLAFTFSGKKCFHEVELQVPEFSKPIEKLDFPLKYTFWKGGHYEDAGSSFSFRYELGKLLGEKSKPTTFLLSAGINPYYVQLEYEPTISNAYYQERKFYGFALNATPRLNFKLNRHFSIDLNVPIRIFNFQRTYYRQDNPILPISQQRFTENKYLFFEPVYTIRLGLMIA